MKKPLLLILTIVISLLAGCSTMNSNTDKSINNAPVLENLTYDHSMELKYANNFSVDYYVGGYALISLSNESRFLVVPEDMKVPEGLGDDISVLQQPISNIYLVASATMSHFVALDALEAIRLSGTDADNWYIEKAAEAMKAGNILYAGKYSAPDYELILNEKCNLTIQSEMINHSPEIIEKLEELGLTVLIDESSYESHPLGRMEWIKLYSVLVDKEVVAEKLFNEQAVVIDKLSHSKNTGKTVAFFYVTSNGSISARNTNDYVAKMINMAGGNYIFDNLGMDTVRSTTTMPMEDFYATAKNADYIIYNSSITGTMESIDQLLELNELFADFKAVQDGNVWCTNQNLYQETNELGSMVGEINTIITTRDTTLTELKHFYKVQ
ncbi:MAG: ABC transporter substrate-binding protein [Clostridia bacterium]|nr:ABC transporter substrate-binding protein [Clostridia bacterium]NCD03469.1 ABC transporter substrate-binding protein [Clostridia bacterium]